LVSFGVEPSGCAVDVLVAHEPGELDEHVVSGAVGDEPGLPTSARAQRRPGPTGLRELRDGLRNVVDAEADVVETLAPLLEQLGELRGLVERFDELDEGIPAVQIGQPQRRLPELLLMSDPQTEMP
jgi:hypothetical protein